LTLTVSFNNTDGHMSAALLILALFGLSWFAGSQLAIRSIVVRKLSKTSLGFSVIQLAFAASIIAAISLFVAFPPLALVLALAGTVCGSITWTVPSP
jgi:hypothetical protein